ncbi:hypothetical protein ACFV24_04740 [Nocardia fluminea]
MPHPRVHALDPLMDAAEQPAVDAGPELHRLAQTLAATIPTATK